MSKVWFVTGCSAGFGKLIAQELLKKSEKVVATARKEFALSDLKGINDKNLLPLTLDVTKQEDITKAVTKACEHFGRIDVLVNNAGYGIIGALEETTTESIKRVFDTNVFGLINLTKEVLPIMRKQKSGHIINMSSVAGVVCTPGFNIYNATKFAVEGISEALSMEVAHLGIKVTLIEPGPFRTEFLGRSLDHMPEIADYKETVGKTRQYIDMDGKQPGDPLKAAHIIIDLANSPRPPLRLPLGNIAVDRIRNKMATWDKEVSEYEKLARSADY